MVTNLRFRAELITSGCIFADMAGLTAPGLIEMPTGQLLDTLTGYAELATATGGSRLGGTERKRERVAFVKN